MGGPRRDVRDGATGGSDDEGCGVGVKVAAAVGPAVRSVSITVVGEDEEALGECVDRTLGREVLVVFPGDVLTRGAVSSVMSSDAPCPPLSMASSGSSPLGPSSGDASSDVPMGILSSDVGTVERGTTAGRSGGVLSSNAGCVDAALPS